MPRVRKIWEKAGRNHFFTKIDGKRVKLDLVSKGENASLRMLEKILKGEIQPAGGKGGKTFAWLADQFLEHSQHENEGETYGVHLLYLQSFKDHVGKRLVSALCEADLDAWCRKHAKGGGQVKAGGRKVPEGEKERTRKAAPWSESTQTRARAIVLAALNYGVRKLGMPAHPLTHVKPGTCGSRERYLTAADKATIRAHASGAFADYLLVLEKTGARPFSEIARLTAADVDFVKGTATLKKWKNSRKQKERKRTIQLVPEVLAVLRKLADQYPEGTLFRNKMGRAWIRQALTARFRRLSEDTGIEVTAYDFRAAYISDALARGVPVAVVAELCGTSIQTIGKHYSRIDKMDDVLKAAALKALG